MRDLCIVRLDGNDRVRVYRLARMVFHRCGNTLRYEIFFHSSDVKFTMGIFVVKIVFTRTAKFLSSSANHEMQSPLNYRPAKIIRG